MPSGKGKYKQAPKRELSSVHVKFWVIPSQTPSLNLLKVPSTGVLFSRPGANGKTESGPEEGAARNSFPNVLEKVLLTCFSVLLLLQPAMICLWPRVIHKAPTSRRGS